MAGVQLRRRDRASAPISLVPMIDVLILLLIFFMVTSTYLNLDFIPAIQADDPGDTADPAAAAPAPETMPAGALLPARTLLVRLQADGQAVIAGQRLDPAALRADVAARIAAQPDLPVVILPSGAASTQALVTLMDALAAAGAPSVRIVRVEPVAGAAP